MPAGIRSIWPSAGIGSPTKRTIKTRGLGNFDKTFKGALSGER